MSKHVIAIAALIALAAALQQPAARTRTTQTSLRGTRAPIEQMQPDTTAAGDAATPAVNPADVSLCGFTKRASDAKESFFITNNTSRRLSAVRLLLRYTALSGQQLHERQVTVPVSLNPGDTQLASVKTFDIQRQFYYYLSPKPRKAATPFKVAYRLLGYDISVGQ